MMLSKGENVEFGTKAISVHPEIYEPSIYSGYKNPIHRCSNCGFGFKIAGRDARMGVVTISTISSYAQEYVTCPKCSNIDNV